jgi:hypothetical protein
LFKNSPKVSSYQHQIITPDGKRYAVKPENIIKSDLTHATLIKFTSNERYDIATISTYNQSALDYINQKPKTFWVFLSGFPAESGKLQLNAGYLQVRENSFANTDGSSEVLQNLLNDGYRLTGLTQVSQAKAESMLFSNT